MSGFFSPIIRKSEKKPLQHHKQVGRQNHPYKKLLLNEEAMATPLLVGAMLHFRDTMGDRAFEFLTWSPKTILMELEEDFGIKMPQGCFDRLMAGITIATTDLFWEDLRTFIPLCNILSGSPITDDFDPATVTETAWAVTEVELLSMDPDNETQFAEEIRAYIYQACQEEGIMSPPSALLPIIGNNISALGSDFSNTPDLYAGAFYLQKSKTLDIDRVIYENTATMYGQLMTLDLGNEVKQKLAELKNSASQELQKVLSEIEELDVSVR